MSRFKIASWAPILVLLSAIAIGNIVVFPAIDDAWLELAKKETTPGSFGRFIYRPVFARLLDLMHPSAHVFELIGIVLTVSSWLLLAVLTRRLFRILFPSNTTASLAATLLVLAPVITAVQFVTLNLVLPVTFPVLCGYAALLLIWDSQKLFRMVGAYCLVVIGMLVSEYALASVAAGVVLLIGRQWLHGKFERKWSEAAGVLLTAAISGYLGFRAIANVGIRPDVSPSSMISVFVADPAEGLLHFVNSVWHCILGGFLVSASAVRFGSEGSLLAAFAFGLLLAAAVAFILRNQSVVAEISEGWRRWVVAAFALIAALIPEFARQGIFTVQSGQIEPFSTRFCVAAAPIAAIMFVRMLESVSRRPVFVSAVVAFVAGHAMFLQIWQQHRNQAIMNHLGDVLLPYVESDPDITVAVVPEYYARAYEVTEKATMLWPANLSRRLWVLWEGEMPQYLHRSPTRSGACEGVQYVNVGTSGVTRSGKIGQMLWVKWQPGSRIEVEPYCVPAYRPRTSDRPDVTETASSKPSFSLHGMAPLGSTASR